MVLVGDLLIDALRYDIFTGLVRHAWRIKKKVVSLLKTTFDKVKISYAFIVLQSGSYQ